MFTKIILTLWIYYPYVANDLVGGLEHRLSRFGIYSQSDNICSGYCFKCKKKYFKVLVSEQFMLIDCKN